MGPLEKTIFLFIYYDCRHCVYCYSASKGPTNDAVWSTRDEIKNMCLYALSHCWRFQYSANTFSHWSCSNWGLNMLRVLWFRWEETWHPRFYRISHSKFWTAEASALIWLVSELGHLWGKLWLDCNLRAEAVLAVYSDQTRTQSTSGSSAQVSDNMRDSRFHIWPHWPLS